MRPVGADARVRECVDGFIDGWVYGDDSEQSMKMVVRSLVAYSLKAEQSPKLEEVGIQCIVILELSIARTLIRC